MDVYEKYFFDVNGYLVVEDILSAEQVAALNEAIDHNRDNIRIRKGELRLSGGVGRHGGEVSIALEGTHGRGDIGSILRWPKAVVSTLPRFAISFAYDALYARYDRQWISLWQCQWD